ncbi:putative transmembrane protein [Erysiphe necator]|uniref:Putative transmembrane protein n=1 Tax=Uncinula necator TaxID=52586 RepID=A0A0B1P4R5_UNCNE|nr:putative transmembrane protein [Erysiphe necator]
MSSNVSANEPSTQAAVETLQDGGGSIKSLDAQKKIVEESRKAGVAAFVFNPNASPEEKAAQVRASIPEGFHHEQKSKAIAVPTDIDNRIPNPDLPSTMASGLSSPMTAGPSSPITAGLSSPMTAGLSSPVSTMKDINRDKPIEKTTLDSQKEDDARWIERAGWAPRFGNLTSYSCLEENLANEQTWIEGKLDEKFFGDWYHNSAVITFACLSSWLVATLGGGFSWLLIILAICGTYYRTSIRRVRRNYRDDISRELSIQKLESDTESLEWINSFLIKFWPIFQPVFAETVINSVDQVLSTSTPAFMDSLRMKTFTLGSKPPRMEHVKTYPRAEDDIILMDWKFSFNPMDRSDMTSRQIKNQVNPKVILEIRIGKALISKGLDVIVEDMAFSGLLRFKIKLQIPFPHVEKVEVSLLEKPHIDYVCKPLGGDTLGFDINFIPGLESFILDQIHANLGPMLYAPNVFPIEVAQMLSSSPIDQAIGALAITIHGAQGLRNPDKFAGTIDPYVVVSFNCGLALGQTKVIKENANPKWNETIYLIVTNFTDNLTFQFYDYNDFRKDKEIGTATLSLDTVEEYPELENEQLEILLNGKPSGLLVADLRFFPVLEAQESSDGSKEQPIESNTGIARITVEQAKDLDGTKSLIGQLNPYAVLLLNNKEIHITRKLKRTNNPIWDNGSKEVLITDRKSARIGLMIKDDRDLATDPILGTHQLKLDDMLISMEKEQEWFNLAGAKTGRVKMKLQWKPVSMSGIGPGTGGYVSPIGVVRFHFKDARKLRNLETLGKSDPYARILVSGIEKGRTVTFKNNLNPDWDEIVYVPVHSTREKLTLEVMDEETIGHDRSLGTLSVQKSEYLSQGENSEFLVRTPEAHIGNLQKQGKGPPRGTLNYTIAFYPCLNIADPEEAEENKLKEVLEKDNFSAQSPKLANVEVTNNQENRTIHSGDKGDEQVAIIEKEKIAKICLSPEELFKYESGLIILKIIDVECSKTNVHLEAIMDDMAFPSFTSSLIRSRKSTLNEMGDCVVRELEFSKITLRIREKKKVQGGEKKDKDQTVAKLTGNSIELLKQCLNNPTILKLSSDCDEACSIKVTMKYIPLNMKLDPCESINNMGKLRVDVLDASQLPSADRNGYSDPFCRFELNGKDVFKTKVQKKTLHPAWNEFFEIDIASRTTAQFKCTVFDWDFGEKSEILGSTMINLTSLESFKAQEVNLELDGKSGSVRLRLLFKPGYVVRSRQGISHLSGTFATPGKIVTGVAGVPLKGVGFAAHGVGKGANFIRKGFKSRKKGDDDINVENADTEVAEKSDNNIGDEPTQTSNQIAGLSPNSLNPITHFRSKSFGASSIRSMALAGSETTIGTAAFTILSATGYPPSTNLMVYLKQLGPKIKTLHRTEHIKTATGDVTFDERKESFKCTCSADTQFQIQVKDRKIFGSDDDLGEGLFFIDDSGTGVEKKVKVGAGSVIIKSNFILQPELGENSPRASSSAFRKSLLGKRENGKVARDGVSTTPTPSS